MRTYQWLNHIKKRFYQITVKHNETYNIIIDYRWGSCVSSRGGFKTLSGISEEEAEKTIEKLMKRRKSRGYELITPIMHIT